MNTWMWNADIIHQRVAFHISKFQTLVPRYQSFRHSIFSVSYIVKFKQTYFCSLKYL
jgi:hypothetical protein